MQKIYIILFAALAYGTACQQTEREQADQELVEEELTNFDSWQVHGDILVSEAADVLTLSGTDEGFIVGDLELEDFLLQGEFLVKQGQRAGVIVRYPASGNPAYSGYLISIDHNLDQQNPTGSIYNVARARWLKSTNPGSWTKFMVDAQGDHLKVMINDTIVSEVHDRRSEEGKLGLLVGNSSKVQFRNLKITELEEAEYLGPQVEDFMRSFDDQPLKALIEEDNFDAWKELGDASWSIEDGVIHGYSNEQGGFLIHQNKYRNFYLKLKFKIAHEDNSGIFIRHSADSTSQVTTDNAIECNIYDHDGFLHEYSTGSIAGHARAWSKMIDYDDWNQMEIFAYEDQIIMYVNGRKSSEAHLPDKFNQSGNICIQGGIQVFNGNLPSDIYIKDMFVRNFDGVSVFTE